MLERQTSRRASFETKTPRTARWMSSCSAAPEAAPPPPGAPEGAAVPRTAWRAVRASAGETGADGSRGSFRAVERRAVAALASE